MTADVDVAPWWSKDEPSGDWTMTARTRDGRFKIDCVVAGRIALAHPRFVFESTEAEALRRLELAKAADP